MNPHSLVAAILALAVLLACLRLALQQWRAPAATRARMWRVGLLLALQPLSAWLLYCTLWPPELATRVGTMTVLTAGATRAQLVALPRAEVQVALPEAPALAGARRVPDLGTALRLHPGTTGLQVVGAGLPARDRDAVGALALAFDPPPPPAGVAELWAPARVAPGGRIRIAGRVHGVVDGAVELRDPAGRRVDGAPPDAQGRFVVVGDARAAGPAPFVLRVLDAGSTLLEEIRVPIWVEEAPPPRVLLLAGAPNPEFKFLRRWAADAGLPMHVRVDVGGGVSLGDAALALDAAELADFDLVVVDERAWAALGDVRRARLADAVADGLGLLLRVTGPLPESTRLQLQALGFAPGAGNRLAELALPAAGSNGSALGGGGGQEPEDADTPGAGPGDAALRLLRRDLEFGAADAAAVSAESADWLRWRPHGQGRVALATIVDSWRLVLAGRGAQHGLLWSEAFAAVARPAGSSAPRVGPHPRAGTRVAICGVAEGALVLAPDGGDSELLLDPGGGAEGCAGYWPHEAGWHRLGQGGQDWPFYVRAAGDAPALAAQALREATLALVREAPDHAAPVAPGQPRRGSSWPWFLGWLGAMTLLWWLERAHRGRHRSTRPSAPASATLP